ncbi:MAG: hypothetical protein U9P14_12685 [Gemmatimonadota bacterium]|nr:hypothetical protein [Gemmatimonadota bacterium]
MNGNGKIMRVLTVRLMLVLGAVFVAGLASHAVARESGDATTIEQKFRQANQVYSQGDYETASSGYRELLRLKGPSAELYYNLGCAELKAGHLGPAMLNLQRASRLAPRDPDIRKNLAFVEALVTSGQEEGETDEGFLTGLVGRWAFSLSAREVGILQVVFLICVTVGVTILALGWASGMVRKIVIGWSVAALVLLAANSMVLAIQAYSLHYSPKAVVLEAGAKALSGPGPENTTVLVLPEGTLVSYGETRGRWVLISLPSGYSGWLPVSMVEKI